MQRVENNTDPTISNRKLASLQRVDDVIKHPNADALEIATVLGWQIVTRVNEVKKGEMVVYCEIDSKLPGDAEWLPDAVKKRVGEQKDKSFFRVKTIKIRGELSQGLIIPCNGLPALEREFDVGTNVTEQLGITKYEVESIPDSSNSPNKFPVHVLDKTEETRVQSNPGVLRVLEGKPYVITVKHDGTSATYLIDPDTQQFLVCSRNQIRTAPSGSELERERCVYWEMAQKYDIESFLREYPNIAIQGEICGPGIQKNLLGLKETEFHVFTIVDISKRVRLSYSLTSLFCEMAGLKMVTLLEKGESFNYLDIKSLLQKAEGKYENTSNEREGIVVRSQDSTVSFKVISNKYLLKNDL